MGFPEMDYVPFYEKLSTAGELTPSRASKSTSRKENEEGGDDEDTEERYYAPRLTQLEYEDLLKKDQTNSAVWINYAFMVCI